MDDEQILNRGGTEEDIKNYAEQNGASEKEPERQYNQLINETLPKLGYGAMKSFADSDFKIPEFIEKLWNAWKEAKDNNLSR